MILVLINFMLLSLTFTIGKLALNYMTPIFFIGFRMFIAGVLLLGYIYLFKKRDFYISKKDLPIMLVISFFHIYLSFILEFWALQYVDSAKACFMFNLSPFVTALFAYIWLGERMTSKKWIGLVIGFIGFLPVLIANGTIEKSVGTFFFFSIPELALLAAASAAAYAWILIKRLMKYSHYSPMMINGFAMFTSSIGAFITAFLVEKGPYIRVPEGSIEQTMETIPYINSLFAGFGVKLMPLFFYTGLLILTSNVIFYNLYAYLLKKYSATFLSFAGITAPLFAAFFGWLLLGEEITWAFYLSLVVVGIGLYIFYQDELKWHEAEL